MTNFDVSMQYTAGTNFNKPTGTGRTRGALGGYKAKKEH